MPDSYRIRTKPGTDGNIQVVIDQEFEFLEILSLKILQDQLYTRQCSDYGVIVGRVSVNNGFGIPNAKVSVFIPQSNEDSNNEIISDLYPYKTLTDLNDDGYRYNLLPYKKSHSGHVPTGTFFTREDVLVDQTLIEVYDKYFKYTAVTNESGDYMIFGVPIGTQTIVLDIDLSDIGEFSLSPQDLIRLGIANESQVAGTRFKSSTNLRELPQIININKVIEVLPLWGQPDICSIGINRTDFDLSNEINLNITPTAIFMGSLVSTNEDDVIKRNCKPRPKSGSLCNLVAGPGEILSIRQTINIDENGRPILETVDLEEGGQVIDENGTWLVDLPMNLDYVITNEFGENVVSNDPKKGIPTKAKYRFKVKWNQSPSLTADPVKRGYFLVPNIREYGWDYDDDPTNNNVLTDSYSAATNSYAFSLDWNDYGYTGSSIGQQMIQDAINCEDKFFEFQYNKVYTVSQLITQYRKGYGNWKIVAIKDILNSECESENVKYPTNDSVYRFDLIYFLFWIMLFIFRPVLYLFLIVTHILAFFFLIAGPLLAIMAGGTMLIYATICPIIRMIISAINTIPGINLSKPSCPSFSDIMDTVKKIANFWKYFTKLKIPTLSYPDCNFCDCSDGEVIETNPNEYSDYQENAQGAEESGLNAILTPFELYNNYYYPYSSSNSDIASNKVFESLFAGTPLGSLTDNSNPLTVETRTSSIKQATSTAYYFTSSLTLSERLNLFNTKAKYFDSSPSNPGGGVNRIKVTFNVDQNVGKYHYDNVITLMVIPDAVDIFQSGNIISFQDPTKSNDINLTGYTLGNNFGTNSITGTPINIDTNIQISYADFTGGSNLSPANSYYHITGSTDDANYAKFPIDIEYFQVVTAMTYSTYSGICGSDVSDNLNDRFLKNSMDFTPYSPIGFVGSTLYETPLNYYNEHESQIVVFLVRGVDPNSTRTKVSYDLSILFGKNIGTTGYEVVGDYHLNHPIQGGFLNVRHSLTNNTDYDPSSGSYLYYDSFHFQPASSGPASFSTFNSNLTSYYSSLDVTYMSFIPDNGVQPLSVGFNYGSNGVYCLATNRYSQEYDGGFTPNIINAKGYYPNEVVEGGSACFLTASNSLMGNISSVYYSPKYPGTLMMNYNMGTGKQIVMRSDRLPMSTTLQNNLNNSFPLHTNVNFSVFSLTDDGTVSQSLNQNIEQNSQLTGTTQDYLDDANDEPGVISSVINSFGCNNMVPLNCYDSVNGELSIKQYPSGCWTPGLSGRIMKNGCYIFVSKIFLSLPTDLILLSEWTMRLQVIFAACRNVWGHLFTNNWINGSLYAFSFKNDAFYDSENRPSFDYCKDVIFLHPTSNNFYYRSSPWKYDTKEFIGKENPTGPISNYGGNDYNLQYPTTILDMGPRNDYIQELVMSDEYDGYVVNKLSSTSYGDVSEILNLLIISRLANVNILQQISSNLGIVKTFFSRSNSMVDGDYAQAISVNSEVGVFPFESMNYPDNPSPLQNPIYTNGANATNQVFGIFYSSDTQVRDYISPRRTIINENVNPINQCAFNNIKVFTQEVPFYQWRTNISSDHQNIFGSQNNNWHTGPLTGSKFFSKKYQSLNRNLPESRYFRTSGSNLIKYDKGYIYSVDNNGNISADLQYKDPNMIDDELITVGSPFHFYFGLKKGRTSFDRFAKKWLDFEKIVD